MTNVNTEQAKIMRNGIDIVGEIHNLSAIREITKREGGMVRVMDAELWDNKGHIKLMIWDDDIELVQHADVIEITNGYTNTFKGNVSLTKGKYGQLKVLVYKNDHYSNIGVDVKNKSLIRRFVENRKKGSLKLSEDMWL